MMIAALAAIAFARVNAVWVILAAALAGILWSYITGAKSHKEEGRDRQ